MAAHRIIRGKYYLLPKQPFTFGPTVLKDPYRLSLYKFLQSFNLKHVTRIEYSFDPFHEQIASLR